MSNLTPPSEVQPRSYQEPLSDISTGQALARLGVALAEQLIAVAGGTAATVTLLANHIDPSLSMEVGGYLFGTFTAKAGSTVMLGRTGSIGIVKEIGIHGLAFSVAGLAAFVSSQLGMNPELAASLAGLLSGFLTEGGLRHLGEPSPSGDDTNSS